MRADTEPPTRPSGFQVLARRWIVEQTIAWLTTNRRLAKDYERLVETGEMLLYLAMSRILLRRLTRKEDNCSPASEVSDGNVASRSRFPF